MGSYTMLRSVFRWLSLVLLSYVGAALIAKPDLRAVLRATFIPHISFNAHAISMLVAVIGTTLSTYLYSRQSNEEVEEDISLGRRRLTDRIGSTKEELRHSRIDVAAGMVFASLVTYFIMLSTAATLFKARKPEISTAAEAAQALLVPAKRRFAFPSAKNAFMSKKSPLSTRKSRLVSGKCKIQSA
ncbi:MAG: natural resistance-associated macrophage protein [Acidobacteriaceae bacterium]|nr:natural resistance-associated macrophage protein [Acidobacteriaceae bacterium]